MADSACYVDGVRTDGPTDAPGERGATVWAALRSPTPVEIRRVARQFGLHALTEEDVNEAHQRAKLEVYGATLAVVLRTARYVEEPEKVEFGELHVVTGPGFVVTVEHAGTPTLDDVRRRLEADPQSLRLGPGAVLHAVLDDVVDRYGPVVAGLENDIDEIEDELFDSSPTVSRRIYELSREVMAFQRATHPLAGVLEQLGDHLGQDGDVELRHRLRDVHDHVLRVDSRVEAFRVLLQNALAVHATLVAQQQNDEMRRLTEAGYQQNEQVKRISAWAAVLFVPTLVATIYGMNFRHIPELRWTFGYPLALLAMVVIALVVYRMFRRRHWL
ncbi:magnesium and cobalt transport protein CorA [Georgenia wutianyii]|uniref:Magnesium and cobalt transport protein CorA n=1 Tax=Georgenia wutianyii TaxID=2585135 RepID=A0ABX5VN86_9MICO|nr:magnesium and cobalt transport protein CorA [Georgenia wutianyii]QDB79974.1 magnesium and cobalt transport protein CorA [Georgenia wutianyii]